jgi:hypothetical protein
MAMPTRYSSQVRALKVELPRRANREALPAPRDMRFNCIVADSFE